jgi:hypothetical protein
VPVPLAADPKNNIKVQKATLMQQFQKPVKQAVTYNSHQKSSVVTQV